ncbi:putative Rho-GTPase-activating protein 6 [Paramyrothecium foliicola]|nr:putative Rho-GTPase-activating protein 6 [Paramyrothecium foliicola]
MAQIQTGPPPPTFQPHPLHHAQRRVTRSGSSGSLAFTQDVAVRQLADHGPHLRSSRTWTTSSGDLGLLSDTDEVEDRAIFVQEYNRLAKKACPRHGVRILIVEDFNNQQANPARSPEKRGWIHRIFRSTSNNNPPVAQLPDRPMPRHKRSVSDLAHNLVHSRREPPKTMEIQDMVRLSGKSALYLPQEYSPCSLILPTCLRATAQYLAQNVTTRGLFRIPGSSRVVNALYDYYCYMGNEGGDIAGTVRCVNLPAHIPSSVHDIASTFKRLLSALPGGILGSLSTLDAFVAIHSHLHGDPEFPRTKQTKVRARLIALAIGTIKSQFRRELICAVFGLLSLIGRVAEVSPREDLDGRPLPTGDLMGYHALGIVFGPLLVGDLLEAYVMKLVAPTSGLLALPPSPQKLRRARRKSKAAEPSSEPPPVDRILVAINITEMLISNWRDVVRQMKAIGTHERKHPCRSRPSNYSLKPSASEPFVVRRPGDWDKPNTSWKRGLPDREGSPEPQTPTLGVKRQRPRSKNSASSFRSGKKPSFGVLSPTAEESLVPDDAFEPQSAHHHDTEDEQQKVHSPFLPNAESIIHGGIQEYDNAEADWATLSRHTDPAQIENATMRLEDVEDSNSRTPRVYMEEIPPRISSKQTKRASQISNGQAGRSTVDVSSHELSSRTEEHELHGGIGVQRSRWPNKKITHNGLASFPNITSTQVPRSSEPMDARKQGDLAFVPPPTLAGTISTSSRNSLLPKDLPIEPIEADSTAPRSDETSYFWMQGNADTERSGSQASGAKCRPESSPKNLDNTRNSLDQQARNSRSVDPTDRDSINTTPRCFYSPMRVPPNLAGQGRGEGVNSKEISARTTSQNESGRKPSREELLDAAERILGSKNSVTGLYPLNKIAESSNTRSWIAQPRIHEAHTRMAAQPKQDEDPVLRPSVSAAASRQGAVRAMAARFEGQDQAMPAEADQRASRSQSLASQYTQKQRSKPVRSSRSGPPWTPQAPTLSSWASQRQQMPREPSNSFSKRHSVPAYTSKPLSSDTVASRAAAIMDVENQAQVALQPDNPYKSYRAPPQSTKAEEYGFRDQTMKTPQSLGTMVPCPEQPPIAHHLNLPRPASSSSLRPPDEGTSSFPHNATPTPRPRSTSILHAHIRTLQRQLDVKIEEAAQLRRQVEAQENTDIGTLSEQLREAKRQVNMWKERAESAERRVKVFERFTARLRGIREAAIAAEPGSTNMADEDWLRRHGSKDNDVVGPHQHVKGESRIVAKGSHGQDMSDDTGRTEDAGVITARIRKCLHDGPGKGDEDDLRDDASSSSDAGQGLDGTRSPKVFNSRDVSQSAVEMWVSAQELLRLDEDNAQGPAGFC